MDLEFYRTQYNFELDQRAHLGSSVNIPIAAATFLFGGLSALTMEFDFEPGLSSVIFSLAVIVAIISLITAIYFIFRSLLGYEYEKLPDPSLLRAHHQSLIAWHLIHGGAKLKADEDFQEYLSDRMSEAVDRNSDNNINRGNYVYRATLSIAVSVIFIVAASAVFLIENVDPAEIPHKVKIIGDITVKSGGEYMGDSDNPSTDQPVESTAATTEAAPDQPAGTQSTKPVGPPNTVFRGHTIIDKSKDKSEGDS